MFQIRVIKMSLFLNDVPCFKLCHKEKLLCQMIRKSTKIVLQELNVSKHVFAKEIFNLSPLLPLFCLPSLKNAPDECL